MSTLEPCLLVLNSLVTHKPRVLAVRIWKSASSKCFPVFPCETSQIPVKWERNYTKRACHISVLKYCLTFERGLVQQSEALGRWILMIVCLIVGLSPDIIFKM